MFCMNSAWYAREVMTPMGPAGWREGQALPCPPSLTPPALWWGSSPHQLSVTSVGAPTHHPLRERAMDRAPVLTKSSQHTSAGALRRLVPAGTTLRAMSPWTWPGRFGPCTAPLGSEGTEPSPKEAGPTPTLGEGPTSNGPSLTSVEGTVPSPQDASVPRLEQRVTPWGDAGFGSGATGPFSLQTLRVRVRPGTTPPSQGGPRRTTGHVGQTTRLGNPRRGPRCPARHRGPWPCHRRT